MCLCLSVTVPHPLRSKEKLSGMFCGQQIPTLNAQPAPALALFLAVTITLTPSPFQAAVLRGAHQPTRALSQTNC